MNSRLIELREVISKLVPMLAGKGLHVTQIGKRAYVKTDLRTRKPVLVNIPMIPDNAEEDFIQAIQGFIDHEIGHVLCTDWNYYGGAPTPDQMRDPKVRAFQNTHNIVEDTMVEREIVRIFPGAEKNIAQLREHFIQKITKPAVASAKDVSEAFRYLLVPMMRALSGHKEFQEYMDESKGWANPLVEELLGKLSKDFLTALKKATNTKQTLELARELHDILYPPKPSAAETGDMGAAISEPDDADEDGESQDKPEKKADQGDGDGERDHTKSDNDEEDSVEEDKSEADKADEDEESDEEDEAGSSDEEEDDKSGGKEEKDDADGDASDDDNDEAKSGSEEGQDDDDDEADAGETGADQDEDDSDEGDAEGNDGGEDGDDENEASGSSGGDDDEDAGEEDDGAASSAGGDDDGDESDGEEFDGEIDPDSDGGLTENKSPEDAEFKDDEPEAGNLKGVGTSSSKSMFDFTDDAFDAADMSSAFQQVISKTIDGMLLDRKTYVPLTRDLDEIAVLVPPENMNPNWVPEMDEKVAHMTGRMQKDIERIMASQSHIHYTPGHKKGKLHSPSLYRVGQGDPRVFQQKEIHISKETAVTLLIDNSGSMGGQKMTLGMLSAYALSLTLDRVKISHEVLGFTTGHRKNLPMVVREAIQQEYDSTNVYQQYDRTEPIVMPIYKEFDERLSPTVKQRIAYAMNAQRGLSGNIDGESVEYAAMRLIKRPEKRKVMLVLSDGQPAGGRLCQPHLRSVVDDCEKKYGIEMIGIGIMDRSVERFYPKHVVLNNVNDLPGQVMSEIKKLLI